MRRKGRRNRVCLFAVLALMCACSPNGEKRDTGRAELPLPDIPQELTSPRDKAEYTLLHFWDAMDFADTLRSHDSQFVEQNFVNFLSLLPHATDKATHEAIGHLLRRAATDGTAFALLCDMAEKYLSEPQSPMRNEEFYIAFLEEQLRLTKPGSPDRLRPALRLQTAKKNRKGTRATDFTYTTRKGERRTLHGTETRGALLLVFYDPACSHCIDIIHRLETSDAVARKVANGNLSVLAVYAGEDRHLWEETKTDMPKAWSVGIDESGIEDRILYDLPTRPVLYLLSHDKMVLLKAPTVEELEAELHHGHNDYL